MTQKAAKPIATTSSAAAARPSHRKERERISCMGTTILETPPPACQPQLVPEPVTHRAAWDGPGTRANWASTASATAWATLVLHESLFIWAASPLLER